MEYVIMIGITLSGKTAYRKANFDHETIQLSYFDNNRKKELEYIEECLKRGKNIIVDDTNLTEKIRKTHIDLAKKYNAKIIGIFMNTSVSLIEQRRLRRNDPFPRVAINKQLKQLQTPTLDEGFDKLLVKKNYESPKNT